MKRQAKRKIIALSTEKEAELDEVRQTINREEKTELLAKGRLIRKTVEATRIELARVAELLKSSREGQGLSLADIQARSGISRAAICRLENLVDANPTVGTLDRIAEALGKRLVIALEDR